MNEHLITQLKRHEGTVKRKGRHIAYEDSRGITTIGYGRNLDNRGLSDDEAELLLANDLKYVRHIVARNLPAIEDALGNDPVRLQVIYNMAFNMGIGDLEGFVLMRRAILAGDFDEAKRQMLNSVWANQVHGRADELAEQMRTGRWQR